MSDVEERRGEKGGRGRNNREKIGNNRDNKK